MPDQISENKSLIKRYPKVLVVSYNCFSLGGATGRTLANLFWGWDKKSIAQLYMSNEIPDNDVCYNYFRVTDIDVINAFRGKKTAGLVYLKKYDHKNKKYDEKENSLYDKLKEMKDKRKIKMKFFRTIIWNLGLWKSKEYYRWLDEFHPDIVFVMAGENCFVDKIGLQISKRYRIPIVVYNCEDYQFKDYSIHGIYGILFQIMLRRSFSKLMAKTNHVIFNNPPLMKLFQKRYRINASVIYISSVLKECYIESPKEKLKISYLGNINNRYVSLLEIARTIKKIDENLVLDVYGRILNPNAKYELENNRDLRYHGVVSYDEVINILSHSDILVHCESFEPDAIIDKRHGFSTKIGDALAGGCCLFVYGPKTNAAVKYLIKYKAACVVTEKEQLENELRNLIQNEKLRAYYRKNALKAAEKNHDIQKSADRVYRIIQNAIKEGYKND
ncbi:glycosyltransferase involved in cell wall biosynthesis [Herbinix hemicellulosilytica]|uniref:Spore protein YkvP/CgeB glycosyl transferase-like domain-containing protein n=1 Tax=Herbinix hemicellulosilytica TaxID=1564487 RepID=A0A0H5SF99_HERHM|nr:glycosyltransferase [Herbinix hemicellulosilytica]RBP58387.1 glycosyltransferase involved in cell wall biosynthesis [Herbinix hemicellulosilytica]CRZ34104.1 hypothetical protein HHT355_0901 [Herbinix hemicellulosilytica]